MCQRKHGRRCRDTCQRAVNWAPVNVHVVASNLEGRDEALTSGPTIADPLVAGSSHAGSLSELRTPEARSKIVSGSRSMQVVEILSVRVLHTLAQKLGAGVSFSLQGKPEVAV